MTIKKVDRVEDLNSLHQRPDHQHPEIKDPTEVYDHDLDAETVNSLSLALSLDYVEKWKVHAQMKLFEKNFLLAEELRRTLAEAYESVKTNLQVTLKNYEEKKIALDFEIKEKEKLQATIKSLRAELKSLKNPKQVSKLSAPEKKSGAKKS